MRGFHRVGQIYGQAPQTIAYDDSFAAQYNTDPQSLTKLHIFSQCLSSATQLTYSIDLELTQYIEFFGRNKPT